MSREVIHYKGFVGRVHYSEGEKVFNGKIEGIRDLVTFEGESVPKLKEAFHEAVQDYLEIANAIGRADGIGFPEIES